jgi:biotin transporter BioY
MLLIVAIGWLYVVLMMSIAEQSVVAGIMTFLLYGVMPVAIILYLMSSPQRKRRRQAEEKERREKALNVAASDQEDGPVAPST